jgi:hypothetical protein
VVYCVRYGKISCTQVGIDGSFDSGLFVESIQASGPNFASGSSKFELSAQTPLEFSKQGPVIRIQCLVRRSRIYPGGHCLSPFMLLRSWMPGMYVWTLRRTARDTCIVQAEETLQKASLLSNWVREDSGKRSLLHTFFFTICPML